VGLKEWQADGSSHGHNSSLHRGLKKWKVRKERRKAKRDPETPPGYGKYKGYEL
jgi:hypothetical protein